MKTEIFQGTMQKIDLTYMAGGETAFLLNNFLTLYKYFSKKQMTHQLFSEKNVTAPAPVN